MILEYHKMDETGQKFRYPVSKQNIMYFQTREDFDLNKIKIGIKTIGNYLMGIDAYLCELDNFAKAYIKEMEDMYNCEYDRYYENY